MLPNLEDLIPLIQNIADEEILTRFQRTAGNMKPDGSIVTEADVAVQHRLAEALRRWPSVQFLGEEMEADEQERLITSGTPTFCLDPVDGTGNYASCFPVFCTSLALLVDGKPQLGVVYDPLRKETFSTTREGGAWLNGQKLTAGSDRVALSGANAFVDLKWLPPALTQKLVEDPPYRSQRNIGSAALEWCWLAAGRVELYVHGAQKIWDFAAASLLLEEVGGVSTTLEGEPVLIASTQPRSVVAARTPDTHHHFMTWAGLT